MPQISLILHFQERIDISEALNNQDLNVILRPGPDAQRVA
jgi:hypothetical protein